MFKQIIIMLILIVSATTISALYSGESETITLPKDYEYYTIVGNSSPVDLQLEQDGLNITITVDKYMKDDSFSLVFFNKEKEIITNTIYTGGGDGSSSTKYIDRNTTKNIPIYMDKEVKVPVDKIVEVTGPPVMREIDWWVWAFVILVSMLIAWIILYLIRANSQKTDDYNYAGYEKV